MKKQRILTGDRTTGKLHLGHYVGSLQNRVKLQDQYETFILLADIQALTTHFLNPDLIHESIYEVAIDNLSAGLDPEKVCFVQQSQIPSIAELTVFYSMLVSVNALRHNPTIKTEAKQYGYDELTYGFLGYPVSQTADITFCNADFVPVGEDQLPHMELSRKIVRRFNELYGNGSDLIHVPQAMLSDTPRLVGLDGNSKMGKSLGNAVYLSDDAETVQRKVMAALTDTNRIALSDKGNPNNCTVSKYHSIFNATEYDEICHNCKAAQIGCVACKKRLAQQLNQVLDPIRQQRAYYENHKTLVREIIQAGSSRANAIGNDFVKSLKSAMRLDI